MRFGIALMLLGSFGLLVSGAPAHGQGVFVPSAGPINSAMAGASTAAPIEFGSTYWNPANLSGLANQEYLLGSALAFPSIHLQTAEKAGAIGGIFPPTNRFGTVRSDGGVPAGLATGVAFRLNDDSPLTLGLGVFGMVGGSVNFPGNPSIPVVAPRQPPKYFGVGPIFSNMSLLGVNPMASVRLGDRLSVGGGPVITSGTVSLNPAFFAPGPKDATGLPTFPPATNARPFWGAGFQIGLLYEVNDNWNVGFSYKSPIWQNRWDYNSYNPDYSPRRIGIQATLPEIISWGIAYKGLAKTILDVDLRYFDYADTQLFGQKVVDGGLGWRSVFAVAFGARYQATERISLMGGYLFNTNPIPDTATLFNAQAPGIITNMLSLGTSLKFNDNVTFTVAWQHGFRNAIEGPILQIPNTSTRLDAQLDTILAGLNVTFGGTRPKVETVVPAVPVPAESEVVTPDPNPPIESGAPTGLTSPS
jgi:long-chain fatty acid transport protein